MARFRFKFQKVLDARNTIEKDKKKDLMIAKRQLAELWQERKRIDNEIAIQRDQFSKHRYQEEKASTWAVMQGYLEMLENLQKAVDNRIERQQTDVDEKTALLMEARRERRAMEILRDKHYEEFMSSENRREQVFLNEIAQFHSIKNNQNTE